METPLLDLAQGEAKKAAGMDQAAENRDDLLAACQEAAVRLAQIYSSNEITADQVYLWMRVHGLDEADLGPAAGSLFRGKQWEWTGRWTKSTRPSNHARMIRVWRLKGGA